MTEELKILITQSVQGQGIPQLKANLKAIQGEMNRLASENKRGSAEYQQLSAKAGEYTNQIKSLRREQQGLSPEIKKSGDVLRQLRTEMNQARNEIVRLAQTHGRNSVEVQQARQKYQQLESQVARTKKEMRELGIANGLSGRSILQLGQNIAVITGAVAMFGQQIARVGKDMLDNFAKQEMAVAKLRRGLESLGDDGVDRLVQQADRLQSTTLFADEDIINAQAMLTTFKATSKEVEILTPRLLDMATSLSQSGDATYDLQSIAIQLGKVYGTELVSSLTRMGVVMSESERTMLKNASGMEKTVLLAQILDNNFKGLSETVGNTTAGRMAQFGNKISDIKEVMGEMIAKALTPFLNMILEMDKGTLTLIATVLSITAVFLALIPVVFTLATAFTVLGLSTGNVFAIIGAIVGIGALVGFATYGMISSTSQLTAEYEKQNTVLEKNRDVLKDLQTVRSGIGTQTGGQRQGIEGEQVQSQVSQAPKQTDRATTSQKEYNEALKRSTEIYPQLVAGIQSKNDAEQVNVGTLDELITFQQNLIAEQEKQMSIQLTSELNALAVEYLSVTSESNKLQKQTEALTSAFNRGGVEYQGFNTQTKIGATVMNLLGQRIGDTAEEVQDSNVAWRESKTRVEEVNNRYIQLLGTVLKMQGGVGILENWVATSLRLGQNINGLTNAVNGLTVASVSSALGIADVVQKYTHLQKIVVELIGALQTANFNLARALYEQLIAEAQKLKDSTKAPTGFSGTKGSKGSSKDDIKEEITNPIEEARKKVEDLKKQLEDMRKEFPNISEGANAFVELKKEIADAEKELARLQSRFLPELKMNLKVENEPPQQVEKPAWMIQWEIDQAKQREYEQAKENLEKGLNLIKLGMQSAVSNAKNIMSIFDKSGSTFVSKMLGFFGDALTIMDSVVGMFKAIMAIIEGINLVRSFIPFLAHGTPDFAGGLAMVGERGAELVNLPSHASVLSNRDFMRFVNNVNVLSNNSMAMNPSFFFAVDPKLMNIRKATEKQYLAWKQNSRGGA